ncbi:hypothetical protein E1B28_008170 [Marasmius oreades]|uniref:Uncharacterized protein n=1 Tax=Marasmius oreades TaxID=181124 RepID=A0A9P7RZC1_9AGAR|nr:uncharacterized protein E1B28_008170 [Marasmius oreades]KAG7091768.1 hypothetical protein E1B28_008170 [Marasmius oreades]
MISYSGKRKTLEDAEGEEDVFTRKRVLHCDHSSTKASEANESDLLTLLDLTSASSETDIHERFEEIAEYLLSRRFQLVIRRHGLLEPDCEEEICYELLEIEFYLWKSGCHEDPFTHGSEEQRISGQWYFHRAPRKSNDSSRSQTSTTGYRGGTRKGLDLTLGGPAVESLKPPAATNSTSSRYFTNLDAPSATDVLKPGSSPMANPPGHELRGGILLRSMRRVDDGKIISGPSLLVDEILKQSAQHGSGTLTISELVGCKWGGNRSAFIFCGQEVPAPEQRLPVMFLRPVKSNAKDADPPITPPIYSSPRIGLELSHPGTLPVSSHPRVRYLDRRYRYFVHPNLLTKNGRVQTFLGILDAVISESSSFDPGIPGRARIQTVSKERISQLTGLTAACATNYLTYYLDGYDRGTLENFVGTAGKGASASPATYLRMMGTLVKMINGS